MVTGKSGLGVRLVFVGESVTFFLYTGKQSIRRNSPLWIYVCVCMSACVHAHVCACPCVRVYGYVCVCACPCMCVYVCACPCVCVHMCACSSMCGYNLCIFLAGQHACVRTINNFFSVDDLQYYTKPHGLEKLPKLDPSLVSSLYPLMTTSNLHPVKVQRQVEQNRPKIADCNSQTRGGQMRSHNSGALYDTPKAGIMDASYKKHSRTKPRWAHKIYQS